MKNKIFQIFKKIEILMDSDYKTDPILANNNNSIFLKIDAHTVFLSYQYYLGNDKIFSSFMGTYKYINYPKLLMQINLGVSHPQPINLDTFIKIAGQDKINYFINEVNTLISPALIEYL